MKKWMMSKKIRTVIEVTDSHIKVMQSKFVRNKWAISHVQFVLISALSQNDLARKLTEVSASVNVHPDETIFVISRRFVILKKLRLPSQQEHELKRMMSLQLVGQIPYSLEDVVYDHVILDRDSSGYTNILACVVHREVLEPALKALSDASISQPKMTISSIGVLGWLQYQMDQKSIELKGAAVLLNIDAQQSEIIFTNGQTLLYSRHISYGVKDLHEEALPGFIEQIDISLKTYKKEQMGSDLEDFLVVCDLPDAGLIKNKLEDAFKMRTRIYTSLQDISLKTHKGLKSLGPHHPSLSIGVGFLLTDAAKEISITPSYVAEEKLNRVRKKEFIQFIILLILSFVLVISIWASELIQKTYYLKKIQKKVKAYEASVKNAKRTIDIVQFFEFEYNKRFFVSDVMYMLQKLTPEEISFRNIQLDQEGMLTIQGYAKDSASVNTFQSRLVQSPMFKDVNLLFSTKRKIFNVDLSDFKLSVQLDAQGDVDDAPVN